MPVWSEVAIDYSAGFTITDPTTGQTYTEEEARNMKHNHDPIVTRLTMRPNKIGTNVLTTEEAQQALNRREHT